MIYNDKFVWLHFPKCAGTKIENIFSRYYANVPGLTQDVIDIKNDPFATWHDSIAMRAERNKEFSLGDRDIICPIRRLPSWLISRFNFEYERSPNLPHDAEMLFEGKFFEQSGQLNHADAYIEKYLPKNILDNKRKVKFLRVEHFESDFRIIFSEYLDLSIIPKDEFSRRENSSGQHIPDELLNKLRASDEIYKNCPKWHFVEQLAYQDKAI